MASALKKTWLAMIGGVAVLALCLTSGVIAIDSAQAVQFGIAPAVAPAGGFTTPNSFNNVPSYPKQGASECAASCRGRCVEGTCRPKPTLKRRPCPKQKHEQARSATTTERADQAS